jgi:hypothetical protein
MFPSGVGRAREAVIQSKRTKFEVELRHFSLSWQQYIFVAEKEDSLVLKYLMFRFSRSGWGVGKLCGKQAALLLLPSNPL